MNQSGWLGNLSPDESGGLAPQRLTLSPGLCAKIGTARNSRLVPMGGVQKLNKENVQATSIQMHELYHRTTTP